MKVLWLTNIPSPYRVDFFNEMGKFVELTVVFEKSMSDERDNSWKSFESKNFTAIILKGINVGKDKSISLGVMKFLKPKMYDAIFVSNAFTPTGMLEILILKIRGMKYIIEGDGGIPKQRNCVLMKIKKELLQGAVAYLSSGKSHDQYYKMHGVDEERIYRFPFTSVYRDSIVNNTKTRQEKLELRKIQNISYEHVVLAVGSFIYRKGFDVLIKAAKYFPVNTGVYIIGGKVIPEYSILLKKHNINNIHFFKFMQKGDVLDWMIKSDVFVLPTRYDIWGLVINEALAAGLPIVTTDMCKAGTELIENDKNGYIIEIDNPEELAQRVNQILNLGQEYDKICQNNVKKAHEFTIEKMVSSHLEIIDNLKAKKIL